MPQERQPIDDLTRLAIIHGTDKWGQHFYTPVYHSVFSKRRHDPIRLLEIGVGGYNHPRLGGSSLSMWSDYFPNGRIVGIDISEKNLSLGERITVRQGSQTDPAFLQKIVSEYGPFDIVVDDGSHIPKDVVQSFQILWPSLKDGGHYVFEDTQTSFWENWGGSLANGGATFQLTRALIDSLNFAEVAVVNPNLKIDNNIKTVKSVQAFHNLVFIEKGDNSEPSNFAYDLKNKFAANAVLTISEELERTPTALGYANLIRIYALGGDFDTGIKTAEDALNRWGDHPAVIAAAADIFRASGDLEKATSLMAALDA